ncbi:hypothetical protein LJR074_001815 [Acidovorax sp. LjRoot74]
MQLAKHDCIGIALYALATAALDLDARLIFAHGLDLLIMTRLIVKP